MLNFKNYQCHHLCLRVRVCKHGPFFYPLSCWVAAVGRDCWLNRARMHVLMWWKESRWLDTERREKERTLERVMVGASHLTASSNLILVRCSSRVVNTHDFGTSHCTEQRASEPGHDPSMKRRWCLCSSMDDTQINTFIVWAMHRLQTGQTSQPELHSFVTSSLFFCACFAHTWHGKINKGPQGFGLHKVAFVIF